jgi:signal transduction histidine kinase/CheY-like chemotaxis protein
MQNDTQALAPAAPLNPLAEAFERSPVPQLSVAADGEFTVSGASDGFLSIAGLFREDIVGRPLFGVLELRPGAADAASLAHLQATLRKVVATRGTGQADGLQMGSAPGATRASLWRAVCAPMVSTGGSVTGIVVGFEKSADAASVSDTQARLSELEEERRRAETTSEIERAKTAFITNVSHEFRTPLTLMLGPVEDLLTRRDLEAGMRDRLMLVYRNALRLQRMVNTLLEFSRVESGHVRPVFETVDLARLTDDIASTFRSTIEGAGLSFLVDCEGQQAPVSVSPDMWEKVVLNLLSNAFKFTFSGGIAVRLRQQSDAAVLEVADTGVGIAEHDVPQLFKRFHRVETAQGRSFEGSGIGLALVHELVQLHGGAVDVSSQPGQGSIFSIRIPLGCEHLQSESIQPTKNPVYVDSAAQPFIQEALRWLPLPAQDGLTSARERDQVPAGTETRFAKTFGTRIVIADDNPDMRTYLHELLSPFYAVESVCDGAAALQAIQRERPALVISDIVMPKLDGFGLIQAVRSNTWLQGVPVILLSSRASKEFRVGGLDAGADDYLAKPFSSRELLARVGALIEREHLRRTAEERLRNAFMKGPSFITILEGPEHRFVFVNDAYVELFGDRKLLGRTVREAFPDLEDQGIYDLLDNAYKTGERFKASTMPMQFEAVGAKPAQELYLDFIYEPLRDESGAVNGIFVEGYDVTAQVRARQELEEASRQKDRFMAILGHELCNPLTPLLQAGEYLQNLHLGDERADRAIATIQRQTGHVTRMVAALLDIGRLTNASTELKREELGLSGLVHSAVQAVDLLYFSRRHRLTVHLRDGDLHVQGDSVRLMECLVNLLTNAAKYTVEGGHIAVRVRKDDGFAVIDVVDNGSGISAELLPRVFDLYAQDDRTPDGTEDGFGVGLAVVRLVARLHGGEASVHSDGSGQGSTFSLRLPLAGVQIAPQREALGGSAQCSGCA